MQLFIKQLNNSIITLDDVEPTNIIYNIKQKIYEQENIPISQQRLIFCGKELSDNQLISYYKFEYEGAINLIVVN